MADELKINGKRVSFDLSKVTHKEYAGFASGSLKPEELSEFLFKISGYTSEQIENLPEPTWRKFRELLREACNEPTEETEKN